MEKTNNYFIDLNKIEGEVSKKQSLSYISWANAWDMVKREYPDSTYTRVRNTLDNSYLFKSGTGGMCEVEVKINNITHSMDLPILDFKNQPVAYDKIDSFQINKTLMRAFTKAIAMHGIGLYVFRGEDLPDEATDKPRIEKKDNSAIAQEQAQKPWFNDPELTEFTKNTDYPDYKTALEVIEKKYKIGGPMKEKVELLYTLKKND